ncbi:hypothetical protein L916_10591 [Phytophthora nicotianae]|uniref:Uncharacterized protein n=1 Tax=Phytophthora nicotianae TaxID=4792 RepID=W2IUG8_PHYNI|nr:hypothetical protein L916_10591 [Phytophthora nicotianae]
MLGRCDRPHPSLPKSHKGNTELKNGQPTKIPSSAGSAHVKRYTSIEAVLHGSFLPHVQPHRRRNPETMAYRMLANGTAWRMVQTLTRALKVYVAYVNQKA